MNVRKIFLHAALILTSVAFVMVFSYSTSPLYNLLGGDSAIFQVVGKYWAQGYLPYVDLFENKGPLIFFINALGYMIHPRTGLMVPQIILMYLSFLFVWRTLGLFARGKTKIFFFALTMFYYVAHYWEGNNAGEFTMPFLAAATYFFLRTLKNSAGEKFLCPPTIGFVYGLSFGGCVLLRTSNAMPTCCYAFLTAIFLLQAREFKTLLKNFLSGVAGFAVIVAPFAIYFAAHGALYDALYGTLLYNLKYTASSEQHWPFVAQLIYGTFNFLPFIITVIIAVFALKQKSTNHLLWSGIFIELTLISMLMTMRPYPHYLMLMLPLSPICFAVLCESSDMLRSLKPASKSLLKNLLFKFVVVIAALFSMLYAWPFVLHLKSVLFNEENKLIIFFPIYDKRAEVLNPNEHENILKLRAIIPDDEKDSFACWGAWNTGAHWILQTDMKPRERFFMNNSQMTRIDPSVRTEFFGNVRRNYPLWILYGTAPNRKPDEPPITFEEDAELEQLLAEKYSLKGEVYIYPQLMKLYRLKD